MTNRRSFLKHSSAAALAALLLQDKALAGTLGNSYKDITAGVQLFTFFGLIDQDVPGTLKKIAAIGYKEIESAYGLKGGYYGMKPKEFATMVSDAGMSWQSQHVLAVPFVMPAGTKMPTMPDGSPMVMPKVNVLRDDMQQIVDELAEGGVSYMVCAYTPTSTLDEIKMSIGILNKAGEACKKAGITFAYHNHDMEFKAIDGKVPYDLLLSETDAMNVKMELDLAWVTKASVDAVELFKKNPGRFPLWHVKDISKDGQSVLPVGEGVVPFKRIFANAKIAGMKHFFVEHDEPKDPYASITTSFANLKKILG